MFFSNCQRSLIDSPVEVPESPSIVEPNYRDSVMLIAEGYVGLRETTGCNDGPDIKRFLEYCGLKEGNPWCVAFIHACFIEAGFQIPVKYPAWSPSWFQKPIPIVWNKTKIDSDFKSQLAQVAGFWIPGKGRIGHAELIKWEDKHNYYTIGGNTNVAGSDEGDGVYQKIRDKSSVYSISDPILVKLKN